eukprot:6479361-Amphidinium_carterae.1
MQAADGAQESAAKHLCKICNHSKRQLSFRNAQGETVNIVARHLPLQGRKLEDGTWATAAAAIYPSDLNRALAKGPKLSLQPPVQRE